VTIEHVTEFGDDWPRDLQDRIREKRSKHQVHFTMAVAWWVTIIKRESQIISQRNLQPIFRT